MILKCIANCDKQNCDIKYGIDTKHFKHAESGRRFTPGSIFILEGPFKKVGSTSGGYCTYGRERKYKRIK